MVIAACIRCCDVNVNMLAFPSGLSSERKGSPVPRRQGGQSRPAAAIAGTGRTRLRDVAHAANVSTMTVVRVLREPHKVAVATRERVEKVLADTGYTPDLVARGLVSN